MKFVTEYRDADAVRRAADTLRKLTTRPWTVMEICGGQTHAILRFGLDRMIPETLTLAHGPGCPVCVTPAEVIESAIVLAGERNVTLCSFGDMLRVPGSHEDLFSAKSRGGDVRVVYSPMDALRLAKERPDRQVVFLAIGFETTAPANAMAVFQAKREGIHNFSALVSQVLVPPAMEAILSAPDNTVNGFLAAGHVCAVTGCEPYAPIAEKYRIPIVVAGFEPLDLLNALATCVAMLEKGENALVNQYSRYVRGEGNPHARKVVEEVFEVGDMAWRGIGVIPSSGLFLRHSYREWDAKERFGLRDLKVPEPADCRAGEVLRGKIRPSDCPAFGVACSPEHPLGALMVSPEGACSAYHRYRKKETPL